MTELELKELRISAKSWLPRRLGTLAVKGGFAYRVDRDGIRLGFQRTRWGSRSSSGTISLNIGLMNVPIELRDYVIWHELSHIKHMNHSPSFWAEVARHDPLYHEHRTQLKKYSPLGKK
jgi:predicted metal-dependent hydrolase